MRRRRHALAGRTVLCGVHDDADVTTAAIASALAAALGLDLVMATVIPEPAMCVPGSIAPPIVTGLDGDMRARAQRTLLRVVSGAGIAGAPIGAYRIRSGAPGQMLAALAQAEDAALVAVSTSVRPWPVRLLIGSATGHLGRHCARPVVVCPRDPRAAMRLREALGWPIPPTTPAEHLRWPMPPGDSRPW
jgi:nucleotide-binding universal stress UspA family protein